MPPKNRSPRKPRSNDRRPARGGKPAAKSRPANRAPKQQRDEKTGTDKAHTRSTPQRGRPGPSQGAPARGGKPAAKSRPANRTPKQQRDEKTGTDKTQARSTPQRGRPGPSQGAPAPKRGKPARPRAASLNVRWSGLRPMADAEGKRYKRFFKLETLASATEKLLRLRNNFIIKSVQRVLGPSEISHLHFELIKEGAHQFVFRVEAGNIRRKTALFAMLTAKRHDAFSKALAIEHEHMQALYERIPSYVARPFGGGRILLPAKRRGMPADRAVYAYLTQWQQGFYELGAGKNGLFAAFTPQPRSFSAAQTEAIRAAIVEMMARAYDPESRTCIEAPDVPAGDLMVSHPTKNEPRLKLTACRRLIRNVSPAKLLHRMAGVEWECPGGKLSLVREQPDVFFEGVKRAAGADVARSWFQHYLHAIDKGRLEPLDTLPREVVETLASR